jgi:hypothetical protein
MINVSGYSVLILFNNHRKSRKISQYSLPRIKLSKIRFLKIFKIKIAISKIVFGGAGGPQYRG